jgi:hypothetical protein
MVGAFDTYLPNNIHSYGMKTNTWKYLQVKITNLVALYNEQAEELLFPSI